MGAIASLRIEDDVIYQRGYKKGLELAREALYNQGEALASRRIALNLLREGTDPALVARVTGLSPAQLAELDFSK